MTDEDNKAQKDSNTVLSGAEEASGTDEPSSKNEQVPSTANEPVLPFRMPDRKMRDEMENGAGAKTPLGLKVFGTLCIIVGVLYMPIVLLLVLNMGLTYTESGFNENSITSKIIFGALIGTMALTMIFLLILGVRLLRGKRRGARATTEIVIVLLIAHALCDLMLYGLDDEFVVYLVMVAILVAMLTYVDPSLSEERKLQRKLRDMETREDAEEGTLGLDETGKGFIQLDFFNLFWIFVIASVLGVIFETIQHMAMVDPGVYQNRTGMLWGPFSPIYGFGACLMTMALNRFHKANPIIIFVVSALIGGGFEYFVSWFLQFAFGITAWDYSDRFLNIGGRTSLSFMCAWGALGLVWIKFLLPHMLRLINKIPWEWRYSVTTVCAALMIFNGVMTLAALDSWYSRLDGQEADNAMMAFCNDHFDNDWMENHFQSMHINPDNATRVD